MRDLNRLYAAEPALYALDTEPAGFEWIDCNDADASVVSLIRRGRATDDAPADWLVTVVNWTPVVREGYRVGVPEPGYYAERLNSDADAYGGSNVGNQGGVTATDAPAHGHPYSLSLTLPPLGAIFLKRT